MNNDFIELKREVDTEISNLLVKFIDLYRVNGLSPYVASVYYRFILASFEVEGKKDTVFLHYQLFLIKTNYRRTYW